MRGLGIGILVTVVLMGVTMNGRTEKLSDAEIIERAKALGMEEQYETTVLAETISDNRTEEAAGSDTISENRAEKKPGKVPSEEKKQETVQEAGEEQTKDEEQSAETVQITVYGGEGSQAVARKLKEAGLIEDISAYDKFLCSNGYDKKICTGKHTLPVGASEKEIAEIITTREK